MTSSYRNMTAQGTFAENTRFQRSKAEVESIERFNQAREWCRKHLPDEHPELAASSALTLRLHGRWPSADQVRDRLRAQGRDMESLRAAGTFEKCP